MKKYIILGIGIGVILTNFFYSLVPKQTVDTNKLVEIEVQKRIKKIEEMQKVDATFKEVVESSVSDKKTENNEEIGGKKYFSKDTSSNAVYYIYIYSSNNKNSVLNTQDRVEEVLETKIELLGNTAYLFSEYPYSVDNSDEILRILKEEYGIEAKKLKAAEISQLKTIKPSLAEIKPVKTKTKKRKVKTKSRVKETAELKTESVSKEETKILPVVENKPKVETVKEETAKEIVVPKE